MDWWVMLVTVAAVGLAAVETTSDDVSTTEEMREARLKERWQAFLAETSKAMDFVNSTSTVVDGIVGRDVMVTCALNKPLRRPHTLSFIRLDDFSLLFVGLNRSTKDQRFQVLKNNDRQWSLQIRNLSLSDAGDYECQINTVPKPRSRVVTIRARQAHIWIVPGSPTAASPSEPVPPDGGGGGSPLTVTAGERLMLDCILDSGPVHPQFILWFKDDQVVQYSADLGRKAQIQLHLNDVQGDPVRDSNSQPFHRSHLIVRDVNRRDSGRYRCSSDLTRESHIDVVVVEGKSSHLEPNAAAAAAASENTAVSSAKTLGNSLPGAALVSLLSWVTAIHLYQMT